MASNQLGVIKKRKFSTDPDVVRRRMAREQRRQDALRLRMAGASYMDIVKANIGYKSTGHVSNDLNRALEEFQSTYETPANMVVLDLARLDDIQRRLTLAFHSGDLSQAGMLLRVMAFRREVRGTTADDARELQNGASTLVNQGIMVVQGSAEDYLKSMMQAAGASPEQQRAELDRIAASNRTAPTEVIDAEIVDESTSQTAPKKKLRRLRKPTSDKPKTRSELDDPLDTEVLEKSLIELEELESGIEKLPTLQLSDPILSIDIPSEEKPKLKRLRVRVKEDSINRNPVSGVPYRNAPRKPSPELSQKRLRARGAKAISSGPNRDDAFPGNDDSTLLYDEIETETLSQRID